jgi:photosystem II stability/assembly factor-like uncharacterized protein
MVPWCSGLAYVPVKDEIAGSNPVGTADVKRLLIAILFASACAPTSTNPVSSSAVATTSAPTAGLSSPSAATPTPAATFTARPSTTPIPLPNAAGVAAAGGGVVWMDVAFDHVFVSLNRGDTWTERTLPPVPAGQLFGQFAFISAGEGWWLSARSSDTQCILRNVVVWKTDDGAATWRQLDATGIDGTKCPRSIQFSGPGVGFIPAVDTAGVSLIYRTTDGGRTWSASTPLDAPPGFTVGPATPLEVGNIGDFGDVLFAEAYGQMSGGVLKHVVYRSIDRGATWMYYVPALQSASVVFVTPTRWLQIVPQDSRVTTDAGRTWAFFATDYANAAPILPQIAFGDANTGYATVRGGLARTLDGGLHWTGLRTPGT